MRTVPPGFIWKSTGPIAGSMSSSFMSVARPVAETTILARSRLATGQLVYSVSSRLRFADVIDELGANEGPDDRFSRIVSDSAGHRQAAIQNDFGDRFPTAIDTEFAARQRPAQRLEARVIDLHEDFAQRDRHAVEVPFARGVGFQLRAECPFVERRPGRFLNLILGPTVAPFDGLSFGVHDDAPHRPASLQLGREARRDRLQHDFRTTSPPSTVHSREL